MNIPLVASEALCSMLVRDPVQRIVFADHRGLEALPPFMLHEDERVAFAVVSAVSSYGYDKIGIEAVARTGTAVTSLGLICQVLGKVMKEVEEDHKNRRPIRKQTMDLIRSGTGSVWYQCIACKSSMDRGLNPGCVLPETILTSLLDCVRLIIMSPVSEQGLYNMLGALAVVASVAEFASDMMSELGAFANVEPCKFFDIRAGTITEVRLNSLEMLLNVLLDSNLSNKVLVRSQKRRTSRFDIPSDYAFGGAHVRSMAAIVVATLAAHDIHAIGDFPGQILDQLLSSARSHSEDLTGRSALNESHAGALMSLSTQVDLVSMKEESLIMLMEVIESVTDVRTAQMLMATMWCMLRCNEKRQQIVKLPIKLQPFQMAMKLREKEIKAATVIASFSRGFLARKAYAHLIRLKIPMKSFDSATQAAKYRSKVHDERPEPGGRCLMMFEDIAALFLTDYRKAAESVDASHELVDEEQPEVVKFFEFWLGGLWLMLYREEDNPQELGQVYEEHENSYWTVPPLYVEPSAPRPVLTQKLLGLLQELIETKGVIYARAQELALGLTWNMCSRDMGLEHLLIPLGIVGTLSRSALDRDASVGHRKLAVGFYHTLLSRPEHQEALERQRAGDEFHQVLLRLIRTAKAPSDMDLTEVATNALAHRALDQDDSMAIVRLGAIQDLLALLQRLDAMPETNEKCKLYTLIALQNVSCNASNQLQIARKGLRTILNVCAETTTETDVQSHIRSSAEAVLGNLTQNPHNRTRLYKTELSFKASKMRTESRRAAATSPPPPPDFSTTPPFAHRKPKLNRLRQNLPSAHPSRHLLIKYEKWYSKTFEGKEPPMSHHQAKPTPSKPLDPEGLQQMKARLKDDRRAHKQAVKKKMKMVQEAKKQGRWSLSNRKDLAPPAPDPAMVYGETAMLFAKGGFESGDVPLIGTDEAEVPLKKDAVQLPHLAGAMCRRLVHTWDELEEEPVSPDRWAAESQAASPGSPSPRSPASPGRAGSLRVVKASNQGKVNRWSPEVKEYREVAEPLCLPQVSKKLLTLERPTSASERLSVAARDLASAAAMDQLVPLGELQVSERPLISALVPPNEELKLPLTVVQPNFDVLNTASKPRVSKQDMAQNIEYAVDPVGHKDIFPQKTETDAPIIALNLQIMPKRHRNSLVFNEAIRFRKPRATLFEHVEGCTVCQQLYTHYLLPNGKKAHIYDAGSGLADELDLPMMTPPPRPLSLLSLLQLKLPKADILSCSCDPSKILRCDYKPVPSHPELPGEHTVDVVDREKKERSDFGNLALQPLRLSIDVENVEKTDRREVWEKVVYKEPWNIRKSIYAPRERESDAKAFDNPTEVQDKMFGQDWSRVTKKERFVNFVSRSNKKNKAPTKVGSTAMVKMVRDLLKTNYLQLDACFMYYSALGSGNVFSMQLNQYTDFLTDCQIPDADSPKIKRSDCDTLFITADFCEDKTTPEAQLMASNNALLRYEFLEVLVRIAVAKYGDGIETCDVSEALTFLLERNIRPNVPLLASTPADAWRWERLYNEELDNLFKSHSEILHLIHKAYITRPPEGGRRCKMFQIDHWLKLLTDTHLINGDFNIREAKLCFLRARMLIIDEVGDRMRYECLTFVDFLEAIARVSDAASVVSDAELREMRYDTVLDYMLACEVNENPDKKGPSGAPHPPRRPSATFGNPKTRPLFQKVEMVLQTMFEFLTYDGKVKEAYSKANLVKFLKEMDKKIERGA
ncbi:hypothetical protein CYMTET_51082 [Cymbomonas tetramitiformis]|uniref:Uncharacterized protein n=1 Tax=Cymbomonas tetramitiformis TaxID=36881 RepID=A0AAE0ES70_9CHLO|nr:hypothetical protein CYMTET_51082 [Cymbomonas tetramitiformis]